MNYYLLFVVNKNPFVAAFYVFETDVKVYIR